MLQTREPGGTAGAERVRALLLSPEIRWSPRSEVLMHFAYRFDHVDRLILPALRAGIWVLCDRYVDSTIVYQGVGQNAQPATIETLAGMLGLVPDLTLVLDVPVATTLARLAVRGGGADRYEALGEVFFRKVRDGFLGLAAATPARYAVVDGTRTVDVVAGEIGGIVAARFDLP